MTERNDLNSSFAAMAFHLQESAAARVAVELGRHADRAARFENAALAALARLGWDGTSERNEGEAA